MYVEQIRSFCAVVDLGSLTRAAKQLHLTQPAVSQHVRSLERAFGLALLGRVGGRMGPTEAGEVVYRHGVEILAHLDRIRGEVDALKGLRGGRVVIGAGMSIGNYVLPPIVARFRRRFPEVQVDLVVESAGKVLERLLRGAIDFGLVLSYRLPSDVATEPLYRDRFVLTVSTAHWLAQRRAERLPRSALASVPLIAMSPGVSGLGQLSEPWLREHGIDCHVEMEFSSWEAIRRVVGSGFGAAFLLYSMVAPEVEAGRLHIVELDGPPLVLDFVLARRRRQRLSPAARAFIQELVPALLEDGLVSDVNQQLLQHLAIRPHQASRTS